MAVGVLTCANAHANTITPIYVSSVGAGPSTWTYAAGIVNSQLQSGDFFTLNDFGFASLVSAPANFFFSQALVGSNGDPGSSTPDSATILNVTFTYRGPTMDVSFNFVPGFVLNTPANSTTVLGYWTSTDHLFGNGAGPQGANGRVQLPGNPAKVPEGGSAVALLGLGLFGVASLRRKFKKA